MSKLFVFGIGGTGSRVLRALSFLLAGGTEINASKIIPIIIDPDRENGDVSRTVQVLQKYQQVRRNLEFQQNSFFKADIQTLGSVRAMADGATVDAAADSFKYNIDGASTGQFDRFLSMNLMTPETKALFGALFTPANLTADLTVGFKGHPNMGSIVLNQFSTSADFQNFAASVADGDRIFIISSIFGGTGAAGFPLLVKNIREGDGKVVHHARLKNTPIGAITVMPYFSVMPGTSIDSNTFVAKTKAALNYYRQQLLVNKQLNALYYLGDSKAASLTPQEGGSNQSNNAHYIEVLAALAIIDFAAQEKVICQNGKAINPVFKEYGLVTGDTAGGYNFKNLGRVSRARIAKPLIQYTYMVNYLNNHLEQAIKNKIAFAKGHQLDTLQTGNFYKDFKDFNEAFITWLREMSVNERKFYPLVWDVVDKQLHNMVNGIIQTKFGRFFPSPDWGYTEFNNALNLEEKGLTQLTPEQRFIALFYKATQNLYQARIEAQMR